MIAYFLGRGASFIAKACGADENAQTTVGLAVGSLFAPIDPVGAGLNLGHSLVKYSAAEGNETAKQIDGLVSAAVVVVSLADSSDNNES